MFQVKEIGAVRTRCQLTEPTSSPPAITASTPPSSPSRPCSA